MADLQRFFEGLTPFNAKVEANLNIKKTKGDTNMIEGKRGVQRLLRAIYNNIDEHNVKALSYLIHYDVRQLMDDIESINLVKVVGKEEDLDE